jgi:hypothetical protein
MPYLKTNPSHIKIGSLVRVKHYIKIPKIDKDKENNLTAIVESIMEPTQNVILDRDLRGQRIWHISEIIEANPEIPKRNY